MMVNCVFILTILWPDGKTTVRCVDSPLEVDRILYGNLDNGCFVIIRRIDNE